MRLILLAAVLSLIAAGAQAGDDGAGAPSVADMLQRKHEHELRAELVAQGRWDEVRKLDEESTRRLRERQEQSYDKLNQQLLRSGNVDGPVSAVVNACEPDSLRLHKLNSAASNPASDVPPASPAY